MLHGFTQYKNIYNEKILGKQILNVYYTKTVCYM